MAAGIGIPAQAALLAVLAAAARAQQGDVEGEPQPPLPAELEVPAAPVLSPAEERATFALEPGFAVELVAAEPLVRDPVQVAWDERGRLYVVEMRGFMPDVDGRGEDRPCGAIALLSDTDGDGRMDARADFLEGLVLPRGVAAARGGALVLAPPELLFCRDTDGDGVADQREVVDTGLGGIESPEHAVNGLVWGPDGAYHNARADWSWRFADGAWRREPTAGGGQWGVTLDDLGRAYYDHNSAALFVDLYPSRYALRNPNHGTAAGLAQHLTAGSRPRPARMTPGVNRGYRADTLDEGYRLRQYTAACAPWILRGDAFPASHRGDAYVCEPAGNLVKRFELDGAGLLVRARETEGPEFLTSTDERFRPVSLRDGPDGNLYVVDMYRGVIQHRLFVTSWLRAQVEARGLEQPTGRGRIWRVVYAGEGAEPGGERGVGRGAPGPDLAEASWTELAETLAHPSGWWRDQAQRLFAEEGAGVRDAREVLAEAACKGRDALGRLHALRALAQVGGLGRDDLLQGLTDHDARVRTAAVELAEPWLAAGDEELLSLLRALAHGGDARLRLQVLHSLGEARLAEADGRMLEVLTQDASSALERGAVLSGLQGRELELLERALAELAWREQAAGRPELLRDLAAAVVREGSGARLARLLARLGRERAAGEAHAWRLAALVDGALAGRPLEPLGQPGWIRLEREPPAQAELASDPRTAALAAVLAWPGRPGSEAAEVPALSGEERARFERGRALYAQVCAACHLPSGRGAPALAPPLRASPFVLGDEGRLLRILMHGLEGPLEVHGARWELEMPAFSASDDDLAAVATYVRREWGHGAAPVEPASVRAVHRASEGRARPWTADEL